MTTDWQNDAGASQTGDRPGKRLPKRAVGRRHPRFKAPAAPVTVPAPRPATTAGAESLPGARAATDQLRLVQYWARQASAKPCWLCGIRLPAEQMMADGGDACSDLRWYCRDTPACTERWTSRTARLAAIGKGTAGTPATLGEQARGADAARPAPV